MTEEERVPEKTLAIIGGGAAGLAAAIAAGERARKLGVALGVDILERDDRVGRTILATGNGRCNFSNSEIDVGKYRNGAFAADVLRSLGETMIDDGGERYARLRDEAGDDVHAFFRRLGLAWREEDGGREYPLANKASSVVDVLRAAAARVGARERCGCAVAAIDPPREQGGRFTLRMADGALSRADAVIVACGGRALSALSLDATGLAVGPMRPVLGPLRVADADIPLVRELDGIRVRCAIALLRPESGGLEREVATERGELLFRKYGVSGIAVFNLSREAEPGDILRVDLLDAAASAAADAAAGAEKFLFARRKLLAADIVSAGGQLTFADMLRGLVLPRVGDALLKREGIAENARFGKPEVPRLAEMLCNLRLTAAGIGDESICQVRRGGLPVAEIDPRTMAVRRVPGLYAAGEALDVDGPCGGYNLHWAWASGILAGHVTADRFCCHRKGEK